MKFFQYYDENHTVRLGFCRGELLADAQESVKKSGAEIPTTLTDLLHHADRKTVLEAYQTIEPVAISGEISFAPAVSAPEKIICIGLNYKAHMDEIGFAREREFPPVFPKYPSSLTGHEQLIHLPKTGEQFDYEAELVIVIGKEAHEVTTEQAQDCIFGYTAGNDFSARDLQFKTGQWLLGKACDDFSPAGPFLVPADALDAEHLHISCRVNGELRQDSNTSNMIFSCAEIVSYLSQYMTLKPGDMIYSGTPDGVILGMPDDRKKWLTHGDTIEVTIEGIGTLKNTIA